jgi:hypothetical protein
VTEVTFLTNVISWFQSLLSNATCTATQWRWTVADSPFAVVDDETLDAAVLDDEEEAPNVEDDDDETNEALLALDMEEEEPPPAAAPGNVELGDDDNEDGVISGADPAPLALTLAASDDKEDDVISITANPAPLALTLASYASAPARMQAFVPAAGPRLCPNPGGTSSLSSRSSYASSYTPSCGLAAAGMMDNLKLAATVEPIYAQDDTDATQPMELVVSLSLSNEVRRGL